MGFTGTAGLVEQPSARAWDPRSGPAIIRRWRGTPEAVEAGRVQAQGLGLRYRVQPAGQGNYWDLEITYGAEETQPAETPLADTWELVGNDLEKNLWEAPSIQAELDKNKGTERLHEIAKLRRLCDAVVAGDEESPDPAHAGQTVKATVDEVKAACVFLDNIDSAPFLAYIQSRARGVESASVSQWVLRRTTVIASNSTIKPALENVGKVFSTDSLKSKEAIPDTIRFDLEVGYWLKRTPTITQTTADKWTITQEWWHADRYDPNIYAEA